MLSKYPFVKQQELTDCAVACLLMIINYYHGNYPYFYIRDLSNTNKDGTSAFDLIESAKKIGFKSYGIKGEIEDINQMILPAIAHLKLEHGYHYVVIYKIDHENKTILIADPASKIRKYSFLDFIDLWTGVLIILYPKETIKFIDDKLTLTNIIMPTIKKYNKLLFKIIFLSIILGTSYFITSFYVQIIIDATNNYESKTHLVLIFILMMACYILKNITNYIRSHILVFLTRRIQLILTSKLFRQLLALPYKYYDKRTTGEIISKFNDFLSIQDYIQKILVFISFDLILLILSIFVLLTLYNNLFYINLLFLVLDCIIMALLKKYYENNNYFMQNEKDKFNKVITESLIGYESIKGLGIEENIYNSYLSRHHTLIKSETNYNNLFLFHTFIRDFLQDISYISQILLISFLIIKDEFMISQLFTYQLFSGYFLTYSTSGINLIRDYSFIKEILKRISFLFNKEKLVEDNNFKISKINFNDFNFGYNENLFANLSLEIKNGEKVLLLGHSGSGKSTILKIMMNYYKIDRGNVLYNDIDINDYSNNDIHSNITYVNQNGMLFTNTIYYNLTLNRSVKKDYIEKIIKLCRVDEIMNKHNLGLNMWISENGQNLSGGERQRIILARALLSNFQILLLDEATNQIDKELEEKIIKDILIKYSDKIIIIVSHRQNLIHSFDKVIEIKEKKLIIR